MAWVAAMYHYQVSLARICLLYESHLVDRRLNAVSQESLINDDAHNRRRATKSAGLFGPSAADLAYVI
jgi:hypothetical protein